MFYILNKHIFNLCGSSKNTISLNSQLFRPFAFVTPKNKIFKTEGFHKNARNILLIFH